ILQYWAMVITSSRLVLGSARAQKSEATWASWRSGKIDRMACRFIRVSMMVITSARLAITLWISTLSAGTVGGGGAEAVAGTAFFCPNPPEAQTPTRVAARIRMMMRAVAGTLLTSRFS